MQVLRGAGSGALGGWGLGDTGTEGPHGAPPRYGLIFEPGRGLRICHLCAMPQTDKPARAAASRWAAGGACFSRPLRSGAPVRARSSRQVHGPGGRAVRAGSARVLPPAQVGAGQRRRCRATPARHVVHAPLPPARHGRRMGALHVVRHHRAEPVPQAGATRPRAGRAGPRAGPPTGNGCSAYTSSAAEFWPSGWPPASRPASTARTRRSANACEALRLRRPGPWPSPRPHRPARCRPRRTRRPGCARTKARSSHP